MKMSVVIPCYNEEITIGKVIEDYLNYFDSIYIINNNCTDKTVEIAKQYKINIINVSIQGKGAAIKEAFNQIDDDVIILTDGDSTYSAYDSYILSKYLITQNLDMCIGNRMNTGYFNENQKINCIGNKIFSSIATKKYKQYIPDLLSGSRVLSKNFFKNIDIKHNGFEIETELTKLCIQNNYKLDFLDITYKARPKNSKSSIHIIRDGIKILKTI